jgi:prepilin-type N-terminal cleavage/methylation domain-containing protein
MLPTRGRFRTSSGFTLAELIIVILMVGVLTAMLAPRVGEAITKQGVRSARSAIVSMHSTARAAAIQRSRRTTLLVSGTTLVVRARHPVTGVLDTIGNPQDMRSRYGVGVVTTRDSLVFDPRGVGIESGTTTIVVSRGAYADTLQISPAGRVLR